MNKENQRVALTRRLLQEALLRLLNKKSVQHITVIELCAEAGINRSTFYKHYGSPVDVMYEISENLLTELIEDVKKGNGTYEDDVRQLCISIKKHEDVVQLLMRHNVSVDLMHFTQRFVEATSSRYLQLLKDFDAESQKLVFTFLAAGSTYAVQAWLRDGIEKTPEEMAQLFCRLAQINWKGMEAR